ncbi:RHS repeat-associated core domain-containing protein [Blastococcus sp. SYSU DS1024]
MVVGRTGTAGGRTADRSEPYGQVAEANLTGNAVTALTPYRFAGGMYDRAAPAYVKFGMRWYDAGIGRFTQQDSLETLADPSRANRNEYAAGNPINSVDPTGKDWEGVLEFAEDVLQIGLGCVGGAALVWETGVGYMATAAAGTAGSIAATLGGCAVGGLVGNGEIITP